ncbi:MAG: rhodanese-like domain-containing protein [Anaerolineales bacterium]
MSPEITVHELSEKLNSQEAFIVLDVREPHELTLAKISDERVRPAPISVLARQGISALPEAARAGELPIYVMCHSGVRSAQVTAWLAGQGLTRIFNVRGGIDEYARKIDKTIGFY